MRQIRKQRSRDKRQALSQAKKHSISIDSTDEYCQKLPFYLPDRDTVIRFRDPSPLNPMYMQQPLNAYQRYSQSKNEHSFFQER